MKQNRFASLFNYVLIFGIILACTTRKQVRIPLPPSVSGFRTPELILPGSVDEDMVSAAKVFAAYANSDEFYRYVRKNVSALEAGNENDLERAITKYRACLGSHSPVPIVLKDYSGKLRSRVIGGWRKTYLAQNRSKDLNAIDRAAHWVHELTHACGFTHFDNDIVLHPSIKRSWPYQVGNAFKSFLEAKAF